MNTYILRDDNTFLHSSMERVMQRSKLVDNMHILVPPIYKEIDFTDSIVTIEYILPVSKRYVSESLEKQDELYKEEFLEYKLPLDTNMTYEAGDIEFQVTFVKVEMDEEGNTIQHVRKTETATLKIIPISAWSDIIPDGALTSIDQRLVKIDAQINALNDTTGMIALNTPTDIVIEDNTLKLTTDEKTIGNGVQIVTNEKDSEDGVSDGVIDLDALVPEG